MPRFRLSCLGSRASLRFSPTRASFSIQIRCPFLLIASFFGLLAGYVVGAVPTVELLEKAGLLNDARVQACVELVYAPLVWLSEESPLFQGFLEWEREVLSME